MIVQLLKLPRITHRTASDGPYALVMAPTRELVQQIEDECLKLCKHTRIQVTSIVGGQDIEAQASAVNKGVDVIIATPGRLMDCIESTFVVLNRCYYLVLDEADRMIEMGFDEQVNKILEAMPARGWKSEDEALALEQERLAAQEDLAAEAVIYRTTNLFSATMPPSLELLAKKYLRRPATVYIGETGKNKRIEQVVVWCKSDKEKRNQLIERLKNGPDGPVIIFVNMKKGCDVVAKGLNALGWSAVTLHSGKSQEQREAAIAQFKEKRADVLVATDVAGRGIDVPGVVHVINHDMPKNIQAYTHRIGRTGRAGMEGLATTLITEDDAQVFYDLRKMLLANKSAVPRELSDHPLSQVAPGGLVDEKAMRRYKERQGKK